MRNPEIHRRGGRYARPPLALTDSSGVGRLNLTGFKALKNEASGQYIEADWDVHEEVDSVRAVGDPEEVKDAAKGGCVIMDKENHVPIKEVLAMHFDPDSTLSQWKCPVNTKR